MAIQKAGTRGRGRRARPIDFDRRVVDWADAFIQDLVASFSSRHPTPVLRVAVAGLYGLAAFHLIYGAILPFFHGAIESVVGVATSGISLQQLNAFATGIIIGGVSFHLLLSIAYLFLSFVVRAMRPWTRAAATLVLIVNFAVAFNSLRTPRIATIFLVLHWLSLIGTSAILLLLWAATTASVPSGLSHRDADEGSKAAAARS